MTFTEEIRLLRHYKKAHTSKPEHYKQKWYWDNSQNENEYKLDWKEFAKSFFIQISKLEPSNEGFGRKRFKLIS